jgi:hypothetical protein
VDFDCGLVVQMKALAMQPLMQDKSLQETGCFALSTSLNNSTENMMIYPVVISELKLGWWMIKT